MAKIRTNHKIIDPGEMDRSIRIHRPTIDRRDTGFQAEDFSPLGEVSAKKSLSPGAGSLTEDIEGIRMSEMRTTDWIIRYYPGLDSSYMIEDVDDGQFYNIEGVEELGRRQFMKLRTFVLVDD